MTQNLRNIKANVISSVTESIASTMNVGGNLNPTANVTYNLGNATHRWKDLFLSNSTIYLGDTTFNSTNVFPFNLVIAPEVLTINVAAPFPGDDISWLWNWQTSTLPYARTTIVNSAQVSVPLYKQGTYQINNFANEQTGTMTQRHGAHLKWIDGAGLDNLVSWAVESGNVSFSDSNINNGATTNVQRINVTVPSSITLPTLVAPNLTSYMTVSCVNSGVYTFSGNGDGDNRTLGPLYRGGSYTFTLDSSLSNDPFYFTTDNGTNWSQDGYYGEYTTGVTGSRNNGTTGKTTIKIVVDSTAPDVLFYQSSKTASKRGAIVIKDLAVETNVNGNYVLYFQHGGEGHKTPVEIRPIPSMVNQMCVVFDATAGKFVPQDLATYVDNTPSFKNKIREVAGTATLIAPNGVAVVPTVLVVEDTTYLPLINNKEGDIAFDSYYETMYVWQGGAWRSTKPSSFPGANITGTVTNATYATTANSVAGANVSGAVGLATYATTANAVAGANVSGQVGNALVAGTVYSSSQPNITSVGSLTNLDITGNITLGGNLTVSGTTTLINSTTVSINDINIVLANNATTTAQANGAGITINGAVATMNYISSTNAFTFSHKIVADGSLLTSITGANVTGQVGNSLVSGTVYTSAQPNITSVGTLTGLTVSGNIIPSANVTYSLGNTTNRFKDLWLSGSTIQLGAQTITTSSSGVSLSGTIGGDGGSLSNIAGANVTGQVGNALVSGTVYTAAQPNITSVGTLSSLSVTGNIASGNANLGNLTTSNYFTGNGSLLTSITGANITGWAPNANNANYLGGVLATNYLQTTGTGTGLTAITGSNVTGQVGNALVAGTVYTASQPNITSVGTLSSLSVTANIVAGNVNAGNLLTANYHSGNGSLLTSITGANVTGFVPNANVSNTAYAITGSNVTGQVGNSLVAGTVYTAAQPNITSVGTLTSLSVTGNITSGNATLGNLTTSNYFSGNGSLLTSLAGANVTGQVGNSLISGTVYTNAQPNITSVGTLTTLSSGTHTISANANIAMSGSLSQIAGGNLVSASYLTGTLTTAAQPNITSVGTLTTLTSGTHTISANSNIAMSGSLSQISGANLVSGTYLTGTLTTAAQPNITSHGALTGLTVSNATGVVDFTTTANVTLGNVSNLHISGGSSGQYLQTNGSGTLTWATASSGGVTAARSIINSYVFGS